MKLENSTVGFEKRDFRIAEVVVFQFMVRSDHESILNELNQYLL